MQPQGRSGSSLAPPARITLRPLGSPMPLGLAGLTIASLLVSGLDLGWVPTAQSHEVGVVLLAAAVPLQLLACGVAFPGRDGAAATSMGILAATWAALGLTRLTSPPGTTSHVLGLELLAAGALLLGAALAQSSGKPLVGGLLVLAAARFGINGVYELTGGGGWQTASGWVGLVVLALALYTNWALVFEEARDRPVLPVGRRGRARRSPAPGSDHPDGVTREAGLRAQL